MTNKRAVIRSNGNSVGNDGSGQCAGDPYSQTEYHNSRQLDIFAYFKTVVGYITLTQRQNQQSRYEQKTDLNDKSFAHGQRLNQVGKFAGYYQGHRCTDAQNKNSEY